jgi:hypothetical protein
LEHIARIYDRSELTRSGARPKSDFPKLAKHVADTIPGAELVILPNLGYLPHLEAINYSGTGGILASPAVILVNNEHATVFQLGDLLKYFRAYRLSQWGRTKDSASGAKEECR